MARSARKRALGDPMDDGLGHSILFDMPDDQWRLLVLKRQEVAAEISRSWLGGKPVGA